MLVALGSPRLYGEFAPRNGRLSSPWFRARIEIGRYLSHQSRVPTFSPNTREGRDSHAANHRSCCGLGRPRSGRRRRFPRLL